VSRLRVVGSFVSPYVRKVLAAIALKGLDYEIDPITPFYGGDEFERLSPLRRIPVLVDGDFTLCDSSAICAYLDEVYAQPPLLPADAKQRAQARWLEEYADTRLGDVFIWGLFYPKIVNPIVWGGPGDQARVEKTLAEDAPREMNWLETQLPAEGFLFGNSIGLADMSIATFFRNGAYAGFEPDPERWPRVAAFVDRALAHDCFARYLPFERTQLSTNPQGRRAALLAAGAPLTMETVGTREPRRGVMRL
jgi:glutathione S-transferase